MSSRSSWRGLHELADAKTKANEIESLLEALHKEHRTLSAGDIKAHLEKLLEDLSETRQQLEELFGQIENDLKDHKNHLTAEADFLKRHYSRVKKHE